MPCTNVPKTRATRLLFLKTIILLLALLVKLIGSLYLGDLILHFGGNDYTYLGDDYPTTWKISTGGAVKMRFEDSVWFNFANSELETQIWQSQHPQNGTIYLGKHHQPYSIAMFHELRCLSYLRTEMIHGRSLRESNKNFTPSRLSRHCLNYLRQMALCRADADLDFVTVLPGDAHVYEYRCNNWTAVYDAVEANQKNHAEAQK